MKNRNWRTVGAVFIAGMVALNAGVIWRVHSLIFEGYGDFASFYTAGKLVQEGHSTELYNPRLQWQAQQEFAANVKTRKGPLPYVRPPFEALLFRPLASLSYKFAFVTWTCLKILILLAIPFLLKPGPRMMPRPLATLLSLAFFPVGIDLMQGQDSIFLLLILVGSFSLLQGGSNLRCGMCLGLGLFKFHLIIPLAVVLLLRGKFKVIAGFVSTAAVLLAISAWMVGWTGMLNYPRYLWELNRAPSLGMIRSQSMPNVRGLITPLVGVGPISSDVHWFLVAIALLGVLVGALLWRDSRTQNFDLNSLGFSCTVVVLIVTSYYVNSYDLTLLLIPLLLLGRSFLDGPRTIGWPRPVFLACMALLLFPPLGWILMVRFDQIYWLHVTVLLLAVSLIATAYVGQRADTFSTKAHPHF